MFSFSNYNDKDNHSLITFASKRIPRNLAILYIIFSYKEVCPTYKMPGISSISITKCYLNDLNKHTAQCYDLTKHYHDHNIGSNKT